MKWLRILLLSVLILVFSMILPTVEALELTHLNDEFVSQLQRDFKKAIQPDFSVKNQLKKKWNCHLYGMRSKLQTTKKNNFLNFQLKNNFIINEGSHIFKKYNKTITGISGKIGPLQDEIRQTSDGRLIGEMTLPLIATATKFNIARVQSIAFPQNIVIAYSVCN